MVLSLFFVWLTLLALLLLIVGLPGVIPHLYKHSLRTRILPSSHCIRYHPLTTSPNLLLFPNQTPGKPTRHAWWSP